MTVKVNDGTVAISGKAGPYRNRAAEGFAPRLQAQARCRIVGREHLSRKGWAAGP